MGKIVLLDDATINKIAAGEVIERPSSVVKEVVENSIDAGATNITIEIKNGGISYIRVTDNGKGIMQDDMEIAFERHATSKLRSADDLNEIKSMGFRGEALASIAAISKVELLSKTKEAENGYRVVVEGGTVLEKSEAGCPNGTTITIENLFFNTPVRYKFLKKDFTESGYIEDVVTRIALIHPDIAIKLINTGRTVIQTSGSGDLQSVIYNIYGKDVAENIINIDYSYEDVLIKGVIGKPVISRSNRTNQLFFVNKRYIKDKTLSGAADQAFKGFVTIGKHGFLVLNIEMDPKKVDVNVNPAILEVRFQDENGIFKAVYHAIKDGLARTDLVASTETIDGIDKKTFDDKDETKVIPQTTFRDVAKAFEYSKSNKDNAEKDENKTEDSSDKIERSNQPIEEKFDSVVSRLLKMQNMVKMAKGEKEISAEEIKEELDIKLAENKNEEKIVEVAENKAKNDTDTKEIKAEESISEIKENIPEQSEDETIGNVENKEDEENKTSTISEEEFQKLYSKMFGSALGENKNNSESENDKKEESNENKDEYATPLDPIKKDSNMSVFEESEEYANKTPYKFIGIAFRTYIIVQIEKELYIIDQHAAHERIMYEKIKENYFNEDEKDSQLMLWPDVISLTHKEMGIFRDNREMFKKAGFMVEEFGENTVKLSGVPTVLLELDTKELFLEALDEINTVARTAKQEIEERFIATVACKAAVKAHMALDKEEVEKLMDELLKLPNPFTCPHGRPTAIKMTQNEIEKKFSRIQN